MCNKINKLIEYIESMETNYIKLSKENNKTKKGVEAILSATTLIRMRAKSIKDE